jgi:DNA-directed RNA polymerase II subunit RPB4
MEYAYDEQYDEEGNLLAMDDDRLQLSRFEMAQLANLSIESVEEAKVLVPTLAPKDDAKLQSLLDELATKRKFQS